MESIGATFRPVRAAQATQATQGPTDPAQPRTATKAVAALAWAHQAVYGGRFETACIAAAAADPELFREFLRERGVGT